MATVETYLVWAVLAISAIATIMCWRRILRTDDLRFFKIANLVISSIPIFGPLLYWFVDMPPRHGMNYPNSHGSFCGTLSVGEFGAALTSRGRFSRRYRRMLLKMARRGHLEPPPSNPRPEEDRQAISGDGNV